MSTAPEAVWDEKLMCYVISLDYNFCAREGQLFMEAGDCCDTSSCISQFESIDPNVKSIQTYSGKQKDAKYLKEGDDWKAVYRKYIEPPLSPPE